MLPFIFFKKNQPGISLGPKREFFNGIAAELLDESVHLFSTDACGTVAPPVVVCSDSVTMTRVHHYRVIGVLMGLALANELLLPLPLSRPLLKSLLGDPIYAEDLDSVDPAVYGGLQFLLQNSDAHTMDMTFSCDIGAIALEGPKAAASIKRCTVSFPLDHV